MNEIQEFCKQYAKPNSMQAHISFMNTIFVELLAIGCIYSQYASVGWILHTLNTIRFFVLFHDMAHYSFFETVWENQIFGEILGLYMIYPFQAWREGHNHHHQHFGILGGEDVSQTILFTKKEYEEYPFPYRIAVRILRDTIVFFFVTVPFMWTYGTFVQYLYRYPWNHGIVITKFAGLLLYSIFASKEMLVSYYCVIVIGGILFHLQHSVNIPYRKREGVWKRDQASLEGSTYLEIPTWLKFFTNGIEYHHIHHLNILVPSYAIGQCHHSYEGEWTGVCTVDYSLALESMKNVMYDEEIERCIPFT